MTTISAVIVVKAGEWRLARALDSIRAQSRPADEILVIATPDDEAAASLTVSAGGRAVIQRGAGLAAARNTAIAEASGELIAFLDHDDIWPPDKLALQAAALTRAGAGYVTGLIRRFDDASETRSAPGRLSPSRSGRTPGAVLARREFFASVGPFDPEFAIACDMDWFIRAAEIEAPVETADVVLWKATRPGSLSSDIERSRRETFTVLSRAIARKRGA